MAGNRLKIPLREKKVCGIIVFVREQILENQIIYKIKPKRNDDSRNKNLQPRQPRVFKVRW